MLLLLGALLPGAATEPALLLGVLAALLLVWALTCAARPGRLLAGPAAAAARERRRSVARRAVPRQRDPDAAGHSRSRAPSELLPAV